MATHLLTALFAQIKTVEVAQTLEAVHWFQTWYGMLAIVVAVLLVPIFLGRAIADMLRMSDYAWKISLVLFATFAAGVVLWLGVTLDKFKLGIDLAGGTILVYELDPKQKAELEQAGRDPNLMEKLVNALSKRIDPAGVKQVTIRKFGDDQIEIIIPKVKAEEVEQLKRLIGTAGNLEFRILADEDLDEALVETARRSPSNKVKDQDEPARWDDDQQSSLIGLATANEDDPAEEIERDGQVRAHWQTVTDPKELAEIANDRNFVTRETDKGLQQLIINGQLRAAWVKVGEVESETPGATKEYRVSMGEGTVSRERGDGGREILIKMDDRNVTGAFLTSARPGFDEGQRSVNFNFNARGAKKFGALTAANVRESGRKRRLGITLDGELLSAPNLLAVIRDSGRITGNFSKEEIDWLVGVLNAGSLPAALSKTPISDQQIDPLLGQVTIDKGKNAIVISLLVILAATPLYYRFCGLVACFALLLNLLLVLGIMVAIGAAFTLPGLAGLVLTVGMAVDANVLIFERLREELDRGAALRMAIRNGFGRATRTIVDANLTTLITGVVLYVIGTDQIRGFAVTLILGIGMSMFTAIFAARIIFDIAEKKRWITKLNMGRILGKTDIQFLSKRGIAAVFSLILITVGLISVFIRGNNLLDIDFLGGSKVEVVFNDMKDGAAVDRKLREYSATLPEQDRLADLKVIGIDGGPVGFVPKPDEPLPKGHRFVVETTLDDIDKVKAALRDNFDQDLGTNSLALGPVTTIEDISATEDGDTVQQDGDAGIDEAGKDEAGKDEVGKDDAGKDDAGKDEAGKDEAGKDEAGKDDAGKDDAGKDDAGKDDAGKDDAGKDDAGKDEAGKDEAGKDEAGDAAPATDNPAADPAQPKTGDGARQDLPARSLLAQAEADTGTPGQPKTATDADSGLGAETTSSDESKAGTESAKTGDTDEKTGDDEKATGADGDGDAPKDGDLPIGSPAVPTDGLSLPPVQSRFAGGSEVQLEFKEKISRETLRAWLDDVYKLQEISPDFEVFNSEVVGASLARKKKWTLQATSSADETQKVIEALGGQLADRPIFPSSTKIGGQVAGKTQQQAFAALFASLIFIVAYIWIRFQRVAYGLAAVVALVHDVLITLGMIAISGYMTGIPTMEAFKISLPILAAFLTIIGYSLNDTIVVFDRIREIRGKSPELTEKMINTSINQTLSRTLLTSLSTLLVVLILYFLGGPGIHGFAYSLVIGVLVGTYSSIFVASPALLWMHRMGASRQSVAQRQLAKSGTSAAG